MSENSSKNEIKSPELESLHEGVVKSEINVENNSRNEPEIEEKGEIE